MHIYIHSTPEKCMMHGTLIEELNLIFPTELAGLFILFEIT